MNNQKNYKISLIKSIPQMGCVTLSHQPKQSVRCTETTKIERNRYKSNPSKQQSTRTANIYDFDHDIPLSYNHKRKVNINEKQMLNTSQIMISLPQQQKSTKVERYCRILAPGARNDKIQTLAFKQADPIQRKLKSDPFPRAKASSRGSKQLRLQMGLDRRTPKALSQFVNNDNLNLRQTFIPEKKSIDTNVPNQKKFQAGLSVISEKSGVLAESSKIDPRASTKQLRNSTGFFIGPKISQQNKIPCIQNIDSPKSLE